MHYMRIAHTVYVQLVRLPTYRARHSGYAYVALILVVVNSMFFRQFCSQKYTLSFGYFRIFYFATLLREKAIHFQCKYHNHAYTLILRLIYCQYLYKFIINFEILGLFFEEFEMNCTVRVLHHMILSQQQRHSCQSFDIYDHTV
jgi:hypothetical protein